MKNLKSKMYFPFSDPAETKHFSSFDRIKLEILYS